MERSACLLVLAVALGAGPPQWEASFPPPLPKGTVDPWHPPAGMHGQGPGHGHPGMWPHAAPCPTCVPQGGCAHVPYPMPCPLPQPCPPPAKPQAAPPPVQPQALPPAPPAGMFSAPPAVGDVAGESRAVGLRGFAVRFPAVTIEFPTIQFPSLMHFRRDAGMFIGEAHAPFAAAPAAVYAQVAPGGHALAAPAAPSVQPHAAPQAAPVDKPPVPPPPVKKIPCPLDLCPDGKCVPGAHHPAALERELKLRAELLQREYELQRMQIQVQKIKELEESLQRLMSEREAMPQSPRVSAHDPLPEAGRAASEPLPRSGQRVVPAEYRASDRNAAAGPPAVAGSHADAEPPWDTDRSPAGPKTMQPAAATAGVSEPASQAPGTATVKPPAKLTGLRALFRRDK